MEITCTNKAKPQTCFHLWINIYKCVLTYPPNTPHDGFLWAVQMSAHRDFFTGERDGVEHFLTMGACQTAFGGGALPLRSVVTSSPRHHLARSVQPLIRLP